MKIIRTIAQLREELAPLRITKTIGLVPTMGYFHAGHISLMEQAAKDCDIVVVSLFVNPTQFGEGEDFDQYPRDLERDKRMAEKAGVDYMFSPDPEEMYPAGLATYVEPPAGLTDTMCGASRPDHFRGVTTVVTKLFNIVQPDKAYFGQKDIQQLIVIENMVRDLNQPVKVIGMPIVREKDGLAMSSRNIYLSPEERKQALALYAALNKGKEMIETGEKDSRHLQRKLSEFLAGQPGVEVDYIRVAGAANLAEMEQLSGKVILAGAVRVGKTRLIDNIILEV